MQHKRDNVYINVVLKKEFYILMQHYWRECVHAALNEVLVTLMQYIKGGNVCINLLALLRMVNNAAIKVHCSMNY